MSIREEDVAELRMAEVSTISAMKVDRPSAWQSEAPILTWFCSSSDLLKDFLSWSLNYYIESKIKFGKDKIIIFSMKLLVSYLMQRVTNQSRLQLKRVSSHSMVDCQTPKIVIRKNSIGYGGHVKLRLRASAGVWTGTWSAKVGGIGTGLKLKYVRT